MFGIFSMIMAFFFSISSFFTVLAGDHLDMMTLNYDPSSGDVWECKVEDESVAVITEEDISGSLQTFIVEGVGEGRTLATATNQKGETLECILESFAEINPYNGKLEYYDIYVLYDFGDFISYGDGITLTAQTPVEGGYWDFGYSGYVELMSEPETVNGVCTFEVMNTSLEDERHGILFTYYSPDGTPLENQFKAFTLTKEGEIVYTPENRLAKIELPSDWSKLIFWELAPTSIDSETAEIISIYPMSETYGGIYIPEDYPSADALKELIDLIVGKMPVGGNDVVVIEALKEGTAKFTLEKVDMYPIVKTDEGGYGVVTEKREILETVTVEVTVDADLNISYEIK